MLLTQDFMVTFSMFSVFRPSFNKFCPSRLHFCCCAFFQAILVCLTQMKRLQVMGKTAYLYTVFIIDSYFYFYYFLVIGKYCVNKVKAYSEENKNICDPIKY